MLGNVSEILMDVFLRVKKKQFDCVTAETGSLIGF
jgi:hypothetical protein